MIKLRYAKVNLTAEKITQTGNFSRFDKGINRITIGDGEDFTFRLTADKARAGLTVTNATFTKADGTEITLKEDSSGNADMYTLSHPTDYLEYRYLIDKDVKCWINMAGLRIMIIGRSAKISVGGILIPNTTERGRGHEDVKEWPFMG